MGKSNSKSGIYVIHNSVNGKNYVGQTESIPTRWREHRRDLRKNEHPNPHLQAAYNKYGDGAFSFFVLEVCPVELLDEREAFWINAMRGYTDGYNLTTGGGGVRGFYDIHGTPVVCVSTGVEYASIASASRATGAGVKEIAMCCNLKARKANGLQWRFASTTQEEWDELYKKRFLCGDNRSVPVVCVDTGEEFPSASFAAKQIGVSKTAVLASCNGKRKTAGGFRWKYKRMPNSEYEELQNHLAEKAKDWEKRRSSILSSEERRVAARERAKKMWEDETRAERFLVGLSKASSGRKKRVLQVETGVVFESVSAASAAFGNPRGTSITRCCNGKIKTAFGYHWRYADEGQAV